MTAAIQIAAAVLLDGAGKVLLVRKAGTVAFMQPGGKIEPGEYPMEALRRELKEEIDLELGADAFTYLGAFSAPAANEPGHQVCAEVYVARITEPVTNRAEIAEMIWIDPATPPAIQLAQLTEYHILPALLAAGTFRGTTCLQ